FPELAEAVRSLRISFVPDLEAEAREEGLARIRRLGVKSSLRAPFIVGDRADMMLTISWRTAVAEPDASTLLLVRRFIDQAGLALEQVERRRAGARAGRGGPRPGPAPGGAGAPSPAAAPPPLPGTPAPPPLAVGDTGR